MSWAIATARAPDGGGLIDHHQHLPLCLQALVDLTQPVLAVGQGSAEDLPPVPAQGRGPVLAPCRRPAQMKTSMSISPAASGCMGAGPAGGRTSPCTHACERPHTQRAVPLINGHQRPAAAGDSRPPDHLRTGANHPRPHQLAQPRTTRDHQQGDEQATLMLSPVVLACLKSNSG